MHKITHNREYSGKTKGDGQMIWAAFAAGVFIGVAAGVVAMCLLQINRDEKERR